MAPAAPACPAWGCGPGRGVAADADDGQRPKTATPSVRLAVLHRVECSGGSSGPGLGGVRFSRQRTSCSGCARSAGRPGRPISSRRLSGGGAAMRGAVRVVTPLCGAASCRLLAGTGTVGTPGNSLRVWYPTRILGDPCHGGGGTRHCGDPEPRLQPGPPRAPGPAPRAITPGNKSHRALVRFSRSLFIQSYVFFE